MGWCLVVAAAAWLLLWQWHSSIVVCLMLSHMQHCVFVFVATFLFLLHWCGCHGGLVVVALAVHSCCCQHILFCCCSVRVVVAALLLFLWLCIGVVAGIDVNFVASVAIVVSFFVAVKKVLFF